MLGLALSATFAWQLATDPPDRWRWEVMGNFKTGGGYVTNMPVDGLALNTRVVTFLLRDPVNWFLCCSSYVYDTDGTPIIDTPHSGEVESQPQNARVKIDFGTLPSGDYAIELERADTNEHVVVVFSLTNPCPGCAKPGQPTIEVN